MVLAEVADRLAAVAGIVVATSAAVIALAVVGYHGYCCCSGGRD